MRRAVMQDALTKTPAILFPSCSLAGLKEVKSPLSCHFFDDEANVSNIYSVLETAEFFQRKHQFHCL